MEVLSGPRPLGAHRVEHQEQVIQDLMKKVGELQRATWTQLEPLDGSFCVTADLIGSLCDVQLVLLQERRDGYHPQPGRLAMSGKPYVHRHDAIATLELLLRELKEWSNQTIDAPRS